MNVIDIFNRNVSDAIKKTDAFYEAWFGKTVFTPEITIAESSDYNCGAMCNELEYARNVTGYFVKCLSIESASGDQLQDLIEAFIDMPRRGSVESDEIYRKRFRFVAVEKSNPHRTTKRAIVQSLSYFLDSVDTTIQIIEKFDYSNLYFQVRIEGVNDTAMALTLDNNTYGFLDQLYLSGTSVGAVSSYVGELIQRIKAAGVDFDILFVEQNRATKTSSAFIGVIQTYKTSFARIKAKTSTTKSSNATIV